MASLNIGTVTITLQALTSGFQRALGQAGGALQALQKQASSIASSFRFIGGALALGGLAAGVSTIANFEDGLAALKGALSADITEAGKLEKNVQLLGRGIRGLALDSRFTATEITEAAVAFTRAGFSARRTFESLQSVINLAQSEDFSIKDAADISINILKGLRISAEEFGRVVDIIVNAGLQANVTVQELGTAFTFAAAVGREFDQSAEEIATSLALLGDNALKGSLGGTSLRQILVFLQKDFAKSNSVLKSLNIELFESAKVGDIVVQKFRPLSQVLQDLQKKAGTAEFIRIFQARALTGALALAGTNAQEVERLIAKTAELGTAQRLAGFRADTLKGELFKLKSAVEELFLAIGFEGGLLSSLRSFSEQLRGFVGGIAQADTGFLKFAARLITTTGQVALIGGAFIAAAGAAAALLSPLGLLVSGIVGLKEGPSIVEEFGEELEKLREIFVAFASKLGADFGLFFVRGFAFFSTQLARKFNDTEFLGINIGQIFSKITGAIFESGAALVLFGDEQQQVLEKAIAGTQAFGKFKIALSELDPGRVAEIGEAAAELEQFKFNQAVLKVNELEAAFEKASQTVKESLVPDIRQLAAELPGEKFEKTRAAIEGLALEATKLERAIELIEQNGSPAKILGDGLDILKESFEDLTKNRIGEFAFETEKLTSKLVMLRDVLREIGDAESLKFADQLDGAIEQFKKNREALESQVKVEFGRGINDGVRELVRGIIQGTNEAVKASEVLRSVVLSEFQSLFEQILAEKFKFDAVFEDNFAGLGKTVSSFLQSAGAAVRDFFTNGGAGQAGQAVSSGVQALVRGVGAAFSGVPVLGTGGIAMAPTLAIVGDRDEAIIPLDRLEGLVGGGGGGNVVVNNFGALPSDQIAIREAGEGRDRVTEIVLGRVAQDIQRGGVVNRALQSRNRVRTRVDR